MRHNNHRMVSFGFASNMNEADLLFSALHMQSVAEAVISGRSEELTLVEAIEGLANSIPVLQQAHLYPGVAEA